MVKTMSKHIYCNEDFTDEEFESYMKNCIQAEEEYLNSDRFKKICKAMNNRRLTSDNHTGLEYSFVDFEELEIMESLNKSRNISDEFFRPVIRETQVIRDMIIRDFPITTITIEPELRLSKLSIAMGITNKLENKGE